MTLTAAQKLHIANILGEKFCKTETSKIYWVDEWLNNPNAFLNGISFEGVKKVFKYLKRIGWTSPQN